MKTLSKKGISEEVPNASLYDALQLFIEHGNISIEHKSAMLFIDSMKKYYRKVKFEMIQADKPNLVKFKII